MPVAPHFGAVPDHLRCPHCGRPLTIRQGRLGCPGSHSFDIAHYGYVDLTAGHVDRGTADSQEMVAAADYAEAEVPLLLSGPRGER